MCFRIIPECQNFKFIVAILATIVIIAFLFARYWYQQRKGADSKETSEINLVQIHIKKKSIGIEQIIQLLKPHSKYLRLKSAQIDKDSEDSGYKVDSEDELPKSNHIVPANVTNDNKTGKDKDQPVVLGLTAMALK